MLALMWPTSVPNKLTRLSVDLPHLPSMQFREASLRLAQPYRAFFLEPCLTQILTVVIVRVVYEDRVRSTRILPFCVHDLAPSLVPLASSFDGYGGIGTLDKTVKQLVGDCCLFARLLLMRATSLPQVQARKPVSK